MSAHQTDQRRYLRFPPDEWEMALIQCSDVMVSESEFDPEVAALVMEESRAGCGLVAIERQLRDRLAEGDQCLVKVARLGLVKAEIRWIKEIDEGVCRLGLHYIE
jgi:hypothetical protein